MKIDIDPRLPAVNDVGSLRVRLYEIWRDLSIKVNASFAQAKPGQTLGNYANDADAAAGGVNVGEFYRNGSVVMQRVV